MTLILATIATWLLLGLLACIALRWLSTACVVSDPWEQRRMAIDALAGDDEGL